MIEKQLIHERYEVIRVIGKGGTSQVFEVLDHRLHHHFAMKRIPKVNVGYQKDAFDYEIQLMAQLHHVSIPRILNCFEDDHYAYAIMELIEGVSLLHYVSNTGVLKQSQILLWMEQICLLFLYLHTHKPMPLLYLDLKPQNIMMNKKGRLYLIDFGSSSWIEDKRVRSATPGYAPKELLYQHEPCIQSDIYSFGRTFYVLYHGHFPHESKKQDRLDKLLLKCCEETLEKRYSSFEQVRKAIVKLRIHTNRHMLYLFISFLLCLLFLFAGIYCFSVLSRTYEKNYLSCLREGKFQEALKWKHDEVEPYQKLYDLSCDDMKKTSCESALQQIEELVISYHQEENSEISLFLALKFMALNERSSYVRAQHYFENVALMDKDTQIESLKQLSIILQKTELNKKDIARMDSLLKKLEKSSEQIVDKQEAFQYRKLCMMLYDSYHKELPNSITHILTLSESTLSLMNKYPDIFTWKQRVQVEELQARGYYYEGFQYYEQKAYEQMVKSYDKAIDVMKNTQSKNRYAMLTDMEMSCFVYGVKDEEKRMHLERLRKASIYATKIEQEEERMYFQNRIEEEWNSWK